MIVTFIKNLLSRFDAKDLETVRREVTDRAMKWITMFFGVIVVMILVRQYYYPSDLLWYQLICYVVLVTVSFFMPKLDYRSKIHVLLIISIIVSAAGYYKLGVLAYSAPLLLFITMMSLFVLGLRWAFFYMFSGLALQLLFFGLFMNGSFGYPTNADSLLRSPVQWMMAISNHLFISLTVLMTVYGIYRHLEESMFRYRRSSQELEKKNKQLQDEMARRKLIEAKLRQTQKLETLGTLSGGIAHDFNNILTPIIGYTSLAIKQLDESDPVQEDLSFVLKGSKRARDLVKQILTFSRQQEIRDSLFDVGELAKETLQFISQTIPKNIEIDVAIESEGKKILADSSQIQQVLINLLTNASQAIGEKNGTIQFGLNYRFPTEDEQSNLDELESEEYAVISIWDSGPGIPDTHIDKVFDPFFTTKAPGEGTGLGLSVVHGIVMSHGGAIGVNSKTDEFTEFKVFLKTATTEACVADGDDSEAIVSGLSLLIVDDETDVTSYSNALLSSDGNSIKTFNDPLVALSSIGKEDYFDLLITDLMMPNMNGRDFIEEVRKLKPTLPAILWSGSASLEPLDEAVPRPLNTKVLQKPFEKSDLYSAIRALILQRDKT